MGRGPGPWRRGPANGAKTPRDPTGASPDPLGPARLAVLREACRLRAPEGRVLAIEHGRPVKRASRLFRGLWWFFWIPGNPEVPTSRDLAEHGLDNEMIECGLTLLERHTTHPDWIEAFLAKPTAQAPVSA